MAIAHHTYVNSLSTGYYGYYAPTYYYYYYYDPWPWDDRSRIEHAQKLEWNRYIQGIRRENKASARYRNRTRINIQTGHTPIGPTMYTERESPP